MLYHLLRKFKLRALTGIILMAAAGLLLLGGGSVLSSGGARLIAVQPLFDAEMCPWEPVSASATPQQAAPPPASEVDRPPLRVVRDTYPTYSAIAVDTTSNEVYLQDENIFGYKVFNRLEDTPPRAGFSEPKRIVAGLKTKMDFNCALYVDPKNGDVYSVSNDTMDTLAIFPREARGDVAPMRELHTPHGTFGIAVDEVQQELYLTVEHTNSVLVYSKTAQADDKPLRTLIGLETQLADPHGIAIDLKSQLMFVTNHGNFKEAEKPWAGKFVPPSITVYPLKASGNAAPLRTITGPRTQLDWPAHIYSDEERGEILVANDVSDSVLVFRETDTGDAGPVRVIKGAKTGIKNPTGLFVDFAHDELWVSNMGNHSAVAFPRGANGNIAPLRTIRSAPVGKLALAIGNPGATAYDSKRQEILVPN